MATSSATKISQLYVSLFGRAPDSAGLAFWTEALDGGSWTLASIAKSMFDTAPARAYYPAGATAEAVVTTFYTNVLGRAPDAEGLAFWVKEYTAAGKDQGAFFAKLITNVVDYKGTDAAGLKSQSLFTNKVTVAEFYGNNNGTIAGATAALTGVTEVASTVDTAKTAILNPVVAGQTFTLTTSSTADLLIGTSGNDTFTGTATTYASGDKIVDASTKDTDTFNLALNGAATPDVTNVELVNVTQTSTSAVALTASSLAGSVQNLTVTRADLTVGGSTIAGNHKVDVQSVNASVVAKVTAGAGTTDLTVVQATKAGITVDGNTATGDIAVTGAATVNVDNAAGTVTHTALSVTAEDAKALTINAAKATSVTTASGETGVVTVNAAAATTVNVQGISGGGTINAAKATSITAAGIDDSGVTINAGTFTSSNTGITVTGGSATTDAATITAAGKVNLVSTTVDKFNLSGNGAAVEYVATATTGAATTVYTLSGSQNVTLTGDAAAFTLTTVTDSTTAGTTTLNLTTDGAAADLSKVATDYIKLSAAQASSSALTVATGANIVVAKDQASGLIIAGKAAAATVNLSTADDTAADGTVIDIVTTGTVDVSSNITTVNLDATVGKFTVATSPAFTAATTATVNVTGTKDVTLGTVTAATVNAANLTGKLNMTSGTNGPDTIYGGSGADTLTLSNTSTRFTVDAGNGNNSITITNAETGSLVSSGTGNDAVALNTVKAIVVATGAGTDTVTVGNYDTDAIIIGGDGTDTLKFGTANALNISDNTNFAFSGFETLDLTAVNGSITMSSTQVGTQTFTVKGDAAADNLIVRDKDAISALDSTSHKYTAASSSDVVDLSNITVDTATVTFQMGQGSNAVTGTSATTDTLDVSRLYSDGTTTGVIEGGSTITKASTGVVVNLGASTIADTTLSAWGAYVPNQGSGIASGKVAYLFDSTATTSNSSASISTVSGFENVTGSAGNDYIVGNTLSNTINGNGGNDFIRAGAGADNITLGTGNSTVYQSTGDSSVFTKGATTLNSISTAGYDIVTGAGAGDTIQLAGYTGAAGAALGLVAVAVTGATVATTGGISLADNKVHVITGVYDASAGTFVGHSAGAGYEDTLVVYDANSAATTTSFQGIILVGTGTTALTFTGSDNGVITIA